MKLELWYSDMIRFMKDASEYTDYYPRLVQKMLPYLSEHVRICDAGSGLGYLSAALAPHVRNVTAVEKHPAAAAVLEETCRKRKLKNVVSRCGAVETVLPPEPYDAMVFCFFGELHEILNTAKQQCQGEVFVFTRNYRNHRFSAGTHQSGLSGYPEFRAGLETLGIRAQQETFSLEFGQPFRNLEDARLFFSLYSKDCDKTLLTDAFVRQKLEQTGRTDYPFYMPHERQIAFFRFSAKDIPEQIGFCLESGLTKSL